ncbi:MAG: YceI family protein [Proteobacteria bacterium]|nr:YceI family protein [Pseudomonadota bacterium]
MKRAAVALLLLFGGGAAAALVWPIDPAHSQAQFSVRTLWFTHERGVFSGVRGELRAIDAEHDVVDAWIDAGSLHMDDRNALREARGPGFFDSGEHPRIHFVSAPFPVSALRDGGVLEGSLELRGQRRDTRFELQPSRCPARPLDCPVQVNGSISRSAFGMHGRRALLSDRVSLELHIVVGEPG